MTSFMLAPNRDTYSESYKFRTAEFIGINGKKSSKSLITYPKRSCKYSAVAFFPQEHRMFLNGMMIGMTFKVIHPLWGRSAVITSSNIGTTIYCDTTNSNFEVGEDVFIVLDRDKHQIVTITSVNIDNIVVSESVSTYKGHLILPSFYGIMTGSLDSTYTGENFAEFNISVEELK